MKIVSVQFDYPGQNRYDKLAQVLTYSIKKNCPNADFELIKLKAPDIKKKIKSKSFASNTLKLEYWLKALKETTDNIIFIDCDMLVLGDLSSAFLSDFDIGYTKRTSSRIPYNGGVVFVKNTPQAIEFIELWNKINKKMYNDYSIHRPWRDKYAGMNQAAFGYVLEKEKYNAKLKSFPCAEWNACVEDWVKINDNTKIVHVKGGLRRAVIGQRPGNGYQYRRAILLWNNLAIEAGLLKGRVIRTNDDITIKHPLVRKVRGLRRRHRK